MDIRTGVLTLLLVAAAPCVAQQIRSATGPAARPLPASPKPAHNSMANGTTPFNCEQYRWPNHPHPRMKAYCERLESQTLTDEARRAGRPGPSNDVVPLPSLGSEAARRSGLSCVGGQAMRKLPNGWEQVSSPSGGWQRCREQ
nr:hypothetical protein [Stenotrophomonas lacuserhaii]